MVKKNHPNNHQTEKSVSAETNHSDIHDRHHQHHENKVHSVEAKHNSEYLSFIPSTYMFPILVWGIFTFYATYGYLQEIIIFRNQINPSIPLLSQYFVGLILSSTISYFISKGSNKGLFGAKEAKCGLLNNFTMTFSNYSLMYVDYPTAMLAKSSKVLPVMLLGLIQKTYNYATYRYVCASVLTLGLIVFNFAKLKFGKSDEAVSFLGYFLLLCSLFLDGMVATYTDGGQKKKQHISSRRDSVDHPLPCGAHHHGKASPDADQLEIIKIEKPDPFRMMIANNVVGFTSSVVFLTISYFVSNSDLLTNITPSMIQDILIIGLWGSFGQVFTYMMINRFNCFLLSIVNTSRKFFSVLFSIFWFNHHVNMIHWIGIFLVLGSIVVDVILSHNDDKNKKKDN